MDENQNYYGYSNAGQESPGQQNAYTPVQQTQTQTYGQQQGAYTQPDPYVYEYEEDAQDQTQQAPVKKKRVGAKIALIAFSLVAALAIIWGMAYTVLRAASRTSGTGDSGTGVSFSQALNTDNNVPVTGGTGDVTESGTGHSKIDLEIAEPGPTVVTDVTKVVDQVMPSIVSIDNNFTDRRRTIYGVYEQEALASGSGVIIGKSETELMIVTNNHVISGANSLLVFFHGNTSAPAQVRGTNAAMDLAVIVVSMNDLDEETKNTIKVATIGDSDTLQLGEPTIAIGNALGIGQSVTTGVVSALNREITMEDGTTGTFIQTDAAINSGNSGGALINSRGELIGINTAKLGGSSIEGMGFAIPITQARETIERLMSMGVRELAAEGNRGYMNISITSAQGVPGAYITTVQDGGAASEVGMQVGDVITKLDDIEISGRDDLITALDYYSVGDTVEVTVNRLTIGGFVEMKFTVTLRSQMGT
ncbi:MAG: trypsin-like peptidase domain-containing protein [Lachnospiraceae bacterium]|nr:trypsin-like peptidase domain-containing protein [Lachnospiraceae bacterium]